MMLWIIVPALLLFILIAPIVLIVTVVRQRRELRLLSERLERLDARVARHGASLAAVPQPGVETAPPPEPIPFPGIAPPARDLVEAAAPAPLAAPAPPLSPPAPGAAIGAAERWASAAAAAPAAPPSGARGFDSSRAEELIGSVWLQNAGAVLLLLGVFFLILWGYTTGRLGPGVLVGAGVALGLTLGWRGDRVARSVPLFGHALIGVGLGIIYLSLYLGHFTLKVLPTPAAFVALVLVSIGSIVVGLRYRVQSIAALGVLGAFVPQLMAAWIQLPGFSMSATGFLGYLAAVDTVVFLLAARAGWSALDLACLLLSTFTWIAQFNELKWGWSQQIGLTAVFTLLGLSPLPRLSRQEGTVRGSDLAVIAVAPLCLIACSWPLLAWGPQAWTAMLLLSLSVVYLAAALWVDARRPERDLWQPLTGAAVLFMTAALERALGAESTPMAWCMEGVLLLWLGARPRGGWLRACGYVVSGLGGLWMVSRLYDSGFWPRDGLPALYAAGIRDLVCVLTVLVGAWLLARRREHLSEAEQRVPELWTVFGNLMLLAWTGREAVHLGIALEGEGGRWALPPDVAAPRGGQRLNGLTAALMALFWMAQAAALVGSGRRSGRGFLRACGYGAGVIAALALLAGMTMADGWSSDQRPILYPTGLLVLGSVGLLAAMALQLAGRRDQLVGSERSMPETLTFAASLVMLAWTAREADHLARVVTGLRGSAAPYAGVTTVAVVTRARVLAASLTSAGWMAQALILLVIGWVRASAFMRWTGLGLIGITVLKFVVVDLQTVDVFWRFVTAIVVGAALLAISYAYQRRKR
jgi:uncharacterized membrane protein